MTTGAAPKEMVGRDAALAVFRHLRGRPRAACTYGRAGWREKGFVNHETLLLPLAADGGTVDRLLIERVFPNAPGGGPP